MRIEVYGKQGCSLCKSAMKKVEFFLDKNAASQGVELRFMDVETEHGAAEGDFFDVFEIPTVLLVRDGAQVLARWDGKPPSTGDLQAHLCSGSDGRQCAAA
jgi:thiol-disulfide isomerase/thioredoxin